MDYKEAHNLIKQYYKEYLEMEHPEVPTLEDFLVNELNYSIEDALEIVTIHNKLKYEN